MADRLTSPSGKQDELALELSLRPKKLAEYIGQDKVKENLKILLDAAKQRNEAVDHILLCGPRLGQNNARQHYRQRIERGDQNYGGSEHRTPRDLAAIVTNLRG